MDKDEGRHAASGVGHTAVRGMKQFINLMGQLVRDESGQGTVEYVLILSASVFGASALSRGILRVLDRGVLTLGAELERNLKTGRTPINVWEN